MTPRDLPVPGPAAAPEMLTLAVAPRRSFGARRSAHALRLVKTLRGEGTLIQGRARRPVHYEIDLFISGVLRMASGALEGDLAGAVDPNPAGDHLVLESGARIEILLSELSADGASFDAKTLPEGAFDPAG